MDNTGYSQIAAASSMPKPQSEHQGALGQLEERVQELGKNLNLLVKRLEPVSNSQEQANKAGPECVAAPAHPVPAIRDLNRLDGFVMDHLRLVKEAIERLAI